MRNIFLAITRTRNQFSIFCYVKALFLFLLMLVCFASSLPAGQVGQPSPVGNMNFPDSQGIRNGVMTSGDACPTKEEIISKSRTLQMPFIANNGQMDEQVRFYAKTFGGTVFVTREGEIVYSLPEGRDGKDVEEQRGGVLRRFGSRGAEGQGEIPGKQDAVHQMQTGWRGQVLPVRVESEFVANGYLPLLCTVNANCPPDRVLAKSLLAVYLPGVQKGADKPLNDLHSKIQNPQFSIPMRGVVLKEQLVGAKFGRITGEQPAVTTVNYFIGNDASKWKTNIPAYNVVNLGDIYKGIELSLKAYGNNVEKLFCVKPGADPCLIKIGLSGVKERGLQNRKSEFQIPALQINTAGELVAETEFGTVRFTKPVAYQEREGKRVYVAVDYSISVPEIDEDERWRYEKPGGGEEPETQNLVTL